MDNWNQLESGKGNTDAIPCCGRIPFPRDAQGSYDSAGMVIHFDLSREASMASVEQAMLGDQRLLVVSQKDSGKENPGLEDVYDVEPFTLIRQVSKLPEHILRVLVEGFPSAHSWLSQTANGIVTQVSYERDDRADIDEVSQKQ